MLYSDKLRLSVLDLTHIELATEEDQAFHINDWASLFKAATWEEIKMLAQKDAYIEEACNTIYQLTQEEKIRLQCEAREDYYRRQRTTQAYIANQENKINEQESRITAQENQIAVQENQIAAQENQIAAQESQISVLETQMAEKEALIAALMSENRQLKEN